MKAKARSALVPARTELAPDRSAAQVDAEGKLHRPPPRAARPRWWPRGEGALPALILTPAMMGCLIFVYAFIVTGIAWHWIFNPETGINRLITAFGGPPLKPGWTTDPSVLFSLNAWLGNLFPALRHESIQWGIPMALIPVVIAAACQLTGFSMAMYIAGMATISSELREAARIDGAGVIRIFTHVMLPLSAPAFVVVAIFQFTNIWNDFLFGVTVLPNPSEQPITVALNNLSGSYSVDWNVVMAGAVIAALPTALVYIFLGRFFIRGLLAGSVKG